MSMYKYHILEQPAGWVALLGSEVGLRRMSLKPTPEEALDELGPELNLWPSRTPMRSREKSLA